VLVIEAKAAPSRPAAIFRPLVLAANDTIAPVVGELLKHYHAFIETVRRMPKIVLSSVTAPRPARHGTGLRHRPLHCRR
jgi:hypothetical protein